MVLAVIAILATVIGRTVFPALVGGKSAGLAGSLDGLREAIYQYRTDVRRYPSNLTYLSSQPSSATDLCGRAVPAPFLADWRGPYTPQVITSGGIPVGDATIQDALEGPVGQGIESNGTLFIVVVDVDSAVAADLEAAYDDATLPAGAYTSGIIRWTNQAPTNDPRGTLRFGLSVRGC